MAARRPTILILAEAQSRAGPEDPPFLDYTRHIMLPAHGKTGVGLDVYVRTRTTTRATLLWGKEDANTLLMEVPTPWGKHHVLAAHAPQINIGCEPYVRWWADIWREVPTSVLVVTDTNSAARLANKGTPRPDDTGYCTFLRAFNLRDVEDLHPVPPETYSCFQRAVRSHIDTVACHRGATFTIASYHCWGSTILSDHHVPLLFTVHPSGGPAGQAQPQYGVSHTRVPPGRRNPIPSRYGRFPRFGAPQEGHRPPARPDPMAERPATSHL